MWKFISGVLLAVVIGIGAFVLMQQINPPSGGGFSSSTTTVAPTSTAAGATTTTLPQVSPEGMTVVKATDLVEAKRQALTAIPADQTAAVEAAKVEYSQARGLLVDAQNAALPQPSMMISWVQLAISIAMMIFMIIVVVVILRSQPPKVVQPQQPMKRKVAPKPPVAPVPSVAPIPPSAPKHRRSTPAIWADEKAFEAWFYAQSAEVQPLLKKERMSWPPGEESARWAALQEAMAVQTASSS